MSEKAAWEHLRARLGDLVLMERITERLNDGVPDISFQIRGRTGAGWLELKYVGSAGKSWREMKLKIPWKSPAQPAWISRWARAGGRAGVLVRLEPDGWAFWWARGDVVWVQMVKQTLSVRSADWVGTSDGLPGLVEMLVSGP